MQQLVMRVPALGTRVANTALHPYEDERANKRLELWFQLANGGGGVRRRCGLHEQVLSALGDVNQDFRESIRMVPAAHRPTLKLWPFGDSPRSGQDIRIKKRYII